MQKVVKVLPRVETLLARMMSRSSAPPFLPSRSLPVPRMSFSHSCICVRCAVHNDPTEAGLSSELDDATSPEPRPRPAAHKEAHRAVTL